MHQEYDPNEDRLDIDTELKGIAERLRKDGGEYDAERLEACANHLSEAFSPRGSVVKALEDLRNYADVALKILARHPEVT